MIYLFRTFAIILICLSAVVTIACLVGSGDGIGEVVVMDVIVAFCVPILWHDSAK